MEFARIEQAIKQAPDLVMPVELDRAKGKYEVAKANLERTQSGIRMRRQFRQMCPPREHDPQRHF